MKRLVLAVLGLVGLLAALSCGGGGPDDLGDTSGTTEGGFGVYGFERAGTQFRFAVIAPADNSMVVDVEAHRAKIAAEGTFSYVLASLDNTRSSEKQQVPKISVVTEDGNTVESSQPGRFSAAGEGH